MHSNNEERHTIEDVGMQSSNMPSVYDFKKTGTNRTRGNKGRSGRSVLEATIERIELAFNDFDKVLVAFSCGKDSGIVLSLTYEYAKQNNLLHKLAFYYEDYEADYKYTHEYAERTFSRMTDVERYWLCLPISRNYVAAAQSNN